MATTLSHHLLYTPFQPVPPSLSSHATLALFLLLSAQAFLICIPLRLHSSPLLSLSPSNLAASLSHPRPLSPVRSLSRSLALPVFLATSRSLLHACSIPRFNHLRLLLILHLQAIHPTTPLSVLRGFTHTRVFRPCSTHTMGKRRVKGRDKETTLNFGPGSKTAMECGVRRMRIGPGLLQLG